MTEMEIKRTTSTDNSIRLTVVKLPGFSQCVLAHSRHSFAHFRYSGVFKYLFIENGQSKYFLWLNLIYFGNMLTSSYRMGPAMHKWME
jgi:hypothetical protein